jgi:hypothetical protein
MRLIKILITSLLLAPFSLAQNYQVDWYVIASGGGVMSSASYNANGTIGQPIVGTSSSANYIIESGFWVGAGAIGGCDYVVGDVNGSASYNGLDITYGVNFFKGGGLPMCPFGSCPVPPCDEFYYCGDVNASCSYNGLDITYGVNYFKGGAGPMPCPDCPPTGLIVTSLPGKVNEETETLIKR